jgi:hypothetical protein
MFRTGISRRAESLPLYSLCVRRIDKQECFKSADVRLRE